MPSFSLSPRHLIAQQFDRRPTLRGILAEDVLQVLISHYPAVATEYPELSDANAFSLMYPPDAQGFVRIEPLMDALLRAFLAGEGVALGEDHHLSLDPPHRFRAFQNIPPQTPIDQINVRLSALNTQINALLASLPGDFRQTQFDYWQANGAGGVQRSDWVRQVLRLALATRLRDQGLDEGQVSVLRGMLAGGKRRPTVHALQVELQWRGKSSLHLLPDLLVSSEQELAGQVLWCSPSGLVSAFDSLDSFANGLRDVFAESYAFDSLRWSRQPADGDPFAQQAALMLEVVFADIRQLRYECIPSVTELEDAFAAASDPAGWFTASDQSRDAEQMLASPDWLQAASEGQRFAYQVAAVELALAQGEAGVRSAQDGVLDLHNFAKARLREQLLEDYPDEANYFPNDLLLHLTVAQGVGGGSGTGPGGGEPLAPVGTLTLTQFAIDNLSSLGAARISRITHRNDQLIMDWMTPAYLYKLVEKVDIGGHYPAYVAEKLGSPVGQSQRLERFAREWRCRLRLDALKAWITGQISETAWRVVAQFCDSDDQHPPRRAAIAQLALRREAGASALDNVQGMYVIRPRDGSLPGVLYRPLYADRPLIETTDRGHLLGLLQQPGELQDSVLDWLAADARVVYDHGGFLEPHLKVAIDDTSILPARPKPPVLVLEYLHDIDQGMYDINKAQLIELADRQSVSTAQSRWALLTQGAWLLFDTVSLLVRGPVGVLLWVMQGVTSLANDLEALRGESAFERSAAVVDLLLNFAMVLMHARVPGAAQWVTERPPRPLLDAAATPRTQGMPFEPAALDGWAAGNAPERAFDHTFVGGENLNGLSLMQRAALKRLRSNVALDGIKPQASGSAAGLYEVKGDYYLRLGGDAYRVRRGEGVYDLVGPEGEQGPFIRRVAGRWQLEGLRLAAGAPVDMSAHSKARIETALKNYQAFRQEASPLRKAYAQHVVVVQKLDASVVELVAKVKQAPADTKLAEALKDAKRNLRDARVQALALIESMTEPARVNDDRLNVPALMRYADEEGAALLGQLESARGAARLDLLGYEQAALHYAWFGGNYEALHQLEAEINGKWIADVAVPYQRYRQTLEGLIAMHDSALRASKSLDRLIPLTAGDASLVFEDKDAVLATLKQQRTLTTVLIQSNQLTYLATMAMRVDKAVSQELLRLVKRMLHGPKLRRAVTSHGHLGFEGLAAKDRIEVLGGALDAYERAIVNADLLIKIGGEEVEVRWLERYRQAMEWLRDEAERAMRVAVGELQLAVPATRIGAYGEPATPPAVVQTISGETILGERRTVGGVELIQQLDQEGAVVDTYEAQAEGWSLQDDNVDLPGPGLPATDLVKAKAQGEALLGHQQWVSEEARRQARALSGQGVIGVIDGHLGLLGEVVTELGNDVDGVDLVARLQGAKTELTALRGDLLVEVVKGSEFPTVALLRDLHAQGRLRVTYEGRRHVLGDGSALDKYPIYLRSGPADLVGMPLWEAHLHYNDQSAAAVDFDSGHLKAWKQRKLGYRDQLQAMRQGNALNIHRATFKLRDVRDILPLA